MMPWFLLLPFCVAADAGVTPPGGTTFHVSRLGDGSDGLSWATAFRSIQRALDAVPDDGGGHRIIIRPDTYMEANLAPSAPGAEGRYNELIGDRDGRLGSGTTGDVIIDSSDTASGGFRSYDWYGPIRAYKRGWSAEHTEPSFSAIGWDRWALRGLYMTGGDGGIFFDCVDRVEPFTVVVEDCVGIGRAFGGGVASCLARPLEPIVFRRCTLWALDFWGDTGGGYVRVENLAPPESPDVIFEDCTLVGPQCALKAGNYGFSTYQHIRCVRTRLAALNFSQPVGTPTDGAIQSVERGDLLHLELENCTVLGYRMLGVAVHKETVDDIRLTTRGDVRAYVQYQQPTPAGVFRLTGWPAEQFAALSPPAPASPTPLGPRELVGRSLCEVSPIVWKGRLTLLECVRPASGGENHDHYLLLRDVESGRELARFAEGYGLACALVHGSEVYVFASRREPDGWHDVTVFHSRDLRKWESSVAIVGEGEQLFNSSVCASDEGFVMAYESSDPRWPAFTAKFARSQDLLQWDKLPEALLGADRYAACPCIRYADGWTYVLYLEQRPPRWWFETWIARSRDLVHWEWSAANPVLRPEGLEEGINASDPDVVEFEGRTLLYYCVGDQRTWGDVRRVAWEGSLARFLASWFREPGIPDRSWPR